MKQFFLLFVLFLAFGIFTAPSAAQEKIEQQLDRDPVLEADANHNLEVAQNYFRTRKAYRAVLMRFEETFAAYPDYSKMDEFLYIAAMSSYYLSLNKGKQKLSPNASDEEKKKYDPQKLREDAVAYFSLIIDKYPNSKYRPEVEKLRKELEPKE
jgi:outer membrane protein assembly factor BamD (BamD/ComL family)